MKLRQWLELYRQQQEHELRLRQIEQELSLRQRRAPKNTEAVERLRRLRIELKEQRSRVLRSLVAVETAQLAGNKITRK